MPRFKLKFNHLDKQLDATEESKERLWRFILKLSAANNNIKYCGKWNHEGANPVDENLLVNAKTELEARLDDFRIEATKLIDGLTELAKNGEPK